MADIPGKLGRRMAFSGGANTITFPLDPMSTMGFQISADGFDIEDATITTLPLGTTTPAPVTIEGEPGSAASCGKGLMAQSVTIGGLTAGDYHVAVYQLALTQ